MKSPAFSAKAEYACVAMLELAARYGGSQPVPLKDIADAHDIPQRFLVQILLQLKAGGLVVSTRGAQGGYELGRAPARITLADVIGAIDRSDVLRAVPATPAVEVVRSVWEQIRDARLRILADTSLAELLERARNTESLTYEI